MQQAIDKAKALIEAHAYIRRFRGKIVVIKLGGSIMDSPDALAGLLEDVCFMAAVGMHPVVVHGGGKAISGAMEKAGLEAQFVQGRRYTDERTLAIAEDVLVNQVNLQINNLIEQHGHRPMGLHSLASCVVFGQRLYLQQQDESGRARKIDIGMVGDVKFVNGKLIQSLCQSGVIPVIAPIAIDASGGKLNINADSVAGHVAASVAAEKLVLVSDTHGIRTGEDDDSLATSLTRGQIEQLVERGTISTGMLPKVEATFTALEGGVGKTHIVDGRISHAMLLEVYTDQGIGTEITL